MDLPDYVQAVSFRIAGPDCRGSKAIRLTTFCLGRLGLRLDALNTALPCNGGHTRRRLRDARRSCPAGVFAVGAIINRAVSQLASDEAFLALGVGDGFPFLAAISGNSDKICIGVDPLPIAPDFESHRRRVAWHRRFRRIRSANHQFHPCDFSTYFETFHDQSIGCCFIGSGSQTDAHAALRECEPRLAENALVLFENANDPSVREAGLAFMQSSRNQYRVLLDRPTPHHGTLTFGNGLLMFQLLGRNATAVRRERELAPPVLVPAA
jgi:hypothetical protein